MHTIRNNYESIITNYCKGNKYDAKESLKILPDIVDFVRHCNYQIEHAKDIHGRNVYMPMRHYALELIAERLKSVPTE